MTTSRSITRLQSHGYPSFTMKHSAREEETKNRTGRIPWPGRASHKAARDTACHVGEHEDASVSSRAEGRRFKKRG